MPPSDHRRRGGGGDLCCGMATSAVSQPEQGKTPTEVLVAAGGMRLSAAIRAAAALDVGTVLGDGPVPAFDVAKQLGADELGTTLLLRALASEGVLGEPSRDVFELGTGGGALLPSARG